MPDVMPDVPSKQRQWPRGPWNVLHNAAQEGSTERTVALLAKGSIDINGGTPEGFTPLMIASFKGYSRIARILLNRGADTSVVDAEHFTALHMSAREGHLAVSKLLVKAGAALDPVTIRGDNPLHLSAFKGRSEVVRVLAEAGANLERGNEQAFSPLHLAAQNGHLATMKALLDAGANPDSRLENGTTPMYMAAMGGYAEAVRMLLRANANPQLIRTTTSPRDTDVALDVASFEGHAEVVREMIGHAGIHGCGGRTRGLDALSFSAQRQRVEVMALLTDAGVVDTGVVLCTAVNFGGLESARFLLRWSERRRARGEGGPGAGPPAIGGAWGAWGAWRALDGTREYVDTIRDPYRRTPLLCCVDACRSGSSRMARLLVDAGADTTSPVRVLRARGGVGFHDTPLAYAARLLRERKRAGEEEDATEEQLSRARAVHHLLLRMEAVRALSWVWPVAVDAPPPPPPAAAGVARGAAEGGGEGGEGPSNDNETASSTLLTATTTTTKASLRRMLPVLKARKRGVLLAALLRVGGKA